MKINKYSSVLTIAGSDSGGGAGIQADLKTFSALGCFGTSAITAITVQNTCGVKDIHCIPSDIVQQQIKAVMDDIKPSAIKIGMIPSAEMMRIIVNTLKDYRQVPIVLDPVMISSSGYKLMEDETISVLKNELFHLAKLVTPNLSEAQILSGILIHNLDDMKTAARLILETGCHSVLVKGGHLKGMRLYDVYRHQDGDEQVFESACILSDNTHGTGCTLSSAIAAFMAQGISTGKAIEKARIYVHQSIESGKDVKTGEGRGPLNHFFNPKKLHKIPLER